MQLEVINRYNRGESTIIVSAGVSSGKSVAAALVAVQELVKQHNIIVGAQSFGALSKVLFNEIRKYLTLFGIEYNYNKSTMELDACGGHIYGFSAENAQGILGLSNIHALIGDEVGYWCEDAYQFSSDRLRGEHIDKPFKLLISSPNCQVSSYKWWIDLLKESDVVYASALDNPFTSDAFKKDLLDRYPIDTPLYIQQVLGRVVNADLLNSILREQDYPQFPTFEDGAYYFGIDCAGEGRDATDFLVRNKRGIVEIVKEYSGNPSKEISILKELYNKYKPKGIAIDNTGGFAKHFHLVDDIIKGMNYVNFGSASSDKQYTNKRTEMYFNFSKRVKEGFFIDKKYKEIYEELRNTTYTISDKGLVGLIPKEMIKKNIGRSPDSSDALVLSFEAEKTNIVDNTLTQVVGNLLNL